MATAHFTDEELACRCGCGLLPPQQLQDWLEVLRVQYGRPLTVTSGARCPAYNVKVSSTGEDGPHTKGAVDLAVSGGDAQRVVALAVSLGFTGIGVNQKGPHDKRFIHLDALPDAPGQPRPWIWSY